MKELLHLLKLFECLWLTSLSSPFSKATLQHVLNLSRGGTEVGIWGGVEGGVEGDGEVLREVLREVLSEMSSEMGIEMGRC